MTAVPSSPTARPALPVQEGSSPCPMCWVRPGVEHELSCDEISPELAAAYIDSVHSIHRAR